MAELSRLRPPIIPLLTPKREQAGDGREEARDRHHDHVLVGDVRQLVGQHALELARLEPLHEPGRDAHRRALATVPGGEGVRQVGLRDRDPRLGQVGQLAEPLDRLVEAGASGGSVTFARMAARAILSPKIWASANPPAITRMTIALVPAAISAAMKAT